MKGTKRWSALMMVAVALVCGCATAHQRHAQTQESDQKERIDAVVNDRSTWVDPAHLY